MLVCGIDIGTTNLKVSLLDEANRIVWIKSEPTPRNRDAFGPVTDAASLLDKITSLLVQGWQERGRNQPIRAISTSGVGEDGLFLDNNQQPVAPAIPWFDLRATEESRELSRLSPPRTGIAMDPTRTAAKWLWSARKGLGKGSTWVSLTDYPLAHWAGRAFMADTLASRTGCYDAVARDWVRPLLEAAQAPALPPVLSAGQVVGTMKAGILTECGVADANTLLIAGGHDHPVAAHAIHRLSPSARVDSMGTANVIYGEAPAFTPDHFDPLIAFMAAIEGPQKVACLGVFEFTAAVNAFPGGMEAVRQVLDLDRIPGEPGPLATSAQSERQLLEWAGMNARLMLDRLKGCGVPDGPLYSTGGWSRSRALMELRASLFGQPLHVPEERELSVLGAGLLARKALGGSQELQIPVTVVEPLPDWQARYAEIYATFADTSARPA